MLTRELVSWIKEDFAPGYAREKILGYIGRAQNEIFGSNCAQTTFTNPSDPVFPIPFLVTTAEKLDYTPSASNLVDSDGNAISLEVNGYTVGIRKIKRVFMNVSSLSTAYDNIFLGRTFDWAGMNVHWSRRYFSVKYREIPCIIYDKTALMDAHIVFAEDPGTYTDRYYIEWYFGPVDLDSENIPCSFDTDQFAEAVFKAVRGYMEESKNGRSDLLDGPYETGGFRKYWIPKIRNQLNGGMTQRKPFQFPTREAG